MKLHFGFEDFPYTARYAEDSPLPKSVKRRAPKRMAPAQEAYGQGKTTAEVAKELEDKYHIVEEFYNMEEANIIELMEGAFGDQIEELVAGTPVPVEKITNKQTESIERRFRNALSGQRFDGVIPGVPTLAAQRGVSHLYRHPYAKREPRPSFIDTGMYQRSFRAWVEED